MNIYITIIFYQIYAKNAIKKTTKISILFSFFLVIFFLIYIV